MSKTKSSEIPHYELLYLVSNKFSEDELPAIKDKMEKTITDNDGVIDYRQDWGKRRLAYKIKGFAFGYYQLLEFFAPGEKMEKINNLFRLNNDILRHQIIKKAPLTEEKRLALEQEATKRSTEEKTVTPKVEEVVKEKAEEPIVESVEQEVGAETPVETEATDDKKNKTKDDKIEFTDLDKELDKILDTDSLL